MFFAEFTTRIKTVVGEAFCFSALVVVEIFDDIFSFFGFVFNDVTFRSYDFSLRVIIGFGNCCHKRRGVVCFVRFYFCFNAKVVGVVLILSFDFRYDTRVFAKPGYGFC